MTSYLFHFNDIYLLIFKTFCFLFFFLYYHLLSLLAFYQNYPLFVILSVLSLSVDIVDFVPKCYLIIFFVFFAIKKDTKNTLLFSKMTLFLVILYLFCFCLSISNIHPRSVKDIHFCVSLT